MKGLNTKYKIEKWNPLSWINDSSFVYTTEGKHLFIITTGVLKPNIWLKTEELTESELTRILKVTYDDNLKVVVVELTDRFLIVENKNENPKILKTILKEKDGANFYLSPENGILAYTKENNLFLKMPNGEELAITQDMDKGIVNGSDYVHRQEFGIHQGIFWSPDWKKIAYYSKDERMVKEYPLVKTSTRQGEASMIRYPMAGMKSEEVKLKIYQLETGKTVTIHTNWDPETYLTCVTWSRDSKSIFIALLNRAQDHLKLLQFDSENGSMLDLLYEEKHPKYVEPENPLFFLKNSPDRFIWQSEKSGFNHLYLFNPTTKYFKPITQGDWEITEIIGQDSKSQWLYFQSTKVSPIDRHIYRVHLKNGKIEPITDETIRGTWQGILSPSGEYLISTYQSVNYPFKLILINNETKKQTLIYEATDPLENLQIPKPELLFFTAADGRTKLFGRITKPHPLEENKRYPVFLYVYGGPHVQLVTNTRLWGAGLLDSYMAQQGFVVLTVDNRGSAHRGLEFENVIHRRLGFYEMQDQVKALREIFKLPYIDSTKTVVHGWSYGGFMTISLMLNFPDLFKAGVAGGPVTDWKWYEVMYGERYMGKPEKNPEGYKATSLLDKVHQLKGKLLIIHGLQDDVVVPQHSLELVESFIKAEKQIDFFPYPSHSHNVRGKDRIHLMEKICSYLIDAVFK